ncbi:hypothetical protein EDI_233760 [Entamoeba dispar SAW760]|uniref:Condensation domain-containing protein n=1 Tax=Entamoeba dispar (strain ATCC PRA-260 / SAW760) TaxID=370354 RepID=B0E6B6_ENTDS|nr:uncharacterized protein EDI_233760 [Entamoeba dispar SAW760]EDR29924.1 hypothetical protein EDI_233760 [Entamoeba dispar SAW760]|eukprot:EDR29924.1 hypothetical protein EDI_233760 [Entamoeba dispar SAW760]
MELSPYEKTCEVLGIQCSFAMLGKLEHIEKQWEQLMNMYPYCTDYEGVNTTTNNPSVEVDIQKKYSLESISQTLDLMIKELSKEIAKTRTFGSTNKSALLMYSYVVFNGQEYTVFAMYQCHCKTDFKSVVLLAQSFLNLFNNEKDKVYPIETSYKVLTDKGCLPSANQRQIIMENLPKNVLRYDCSHLKDPHSIQSVLDDPIPNCMTSVTIKLTKNEFNSFALWCRSRHLSIQATLLAIELKAYEKLFDRKGNNAESISFLVPFDLRRFLPFESDCIGLLSETIYPTLPISIINQSIEQISICLTKKLKEVTNINSEAFDRYRDAYYCGNMALMGVKHTCSVSNVSSFAVMNGLSQPLKDRFVDFHMSGCVRVPCNSMMEDLTIHTYSLVDGSFNCSLTYPYGIIQTSVAEAVLKTFKDIINTIN